jgi:hypothetical protein
MSFVGHVCDFCLRLEFGCSMHRALPHATVVSFVMTARREAGNVGNITIKGN